VGDDKIPGLVALVARGSQVHVVTAGSLTIGGEPVGRNSSSSRVSTRKLERVEWRSSQRARRCP
jgi:hypothetical protein